MALPPPVVQATVFPVAVAPPPLMNPPPNTAPVAAVNDPIKRDSYEGLVVRQAHTVVHGRSGRKERTVARMAALRVIRGAYPNVSAAAVTRDLDTRIKEAFRASVGLVRTERDEDATAEGLRLAFEGLPMPAYPHFPGFSVLGSAALFGVSSAALAVRRESPQAVIAKAIGFSATCYVVARSVSRAIGLFAEHYDVPVLSSFAFGRRQADWWQTLRAYREAGGSLNA